MIDTLAALNDRVRKYAKVHGISVFSRSISDNVKRLDDAQGCANKICELFTPQMVIQRNKLKEYCERLIFSDPLGYGIKTEDLLWRKVFYDLISTAKRLKKPDYAPEEKYELSAHINGGIGYYHHYISRLENEFNLPIVRTLDFFIENDETKSCENQEMMDWANCSVHRSLVCLGDLNRYRFDIFPDEDPHKAFRYYMQALSINPDIGMPHNQMGTLASSLNQNLDSVYHYIQCLMSKTPFNRTENNLHKLFEKNSQYLEQLPAENYQVETIVAPEPTELIKKFIARFLLLTDIWFFNKKVPQVYDLCHKTNIELEKCLSFSLPVASVCSGSQNGDSEQPETPPSPTYLTPDISNKIIVICLLCITKLQNDKNSSQLSNVIAFTLAVYSQLIQHVINRIQEGILNFPLTEDEMNSMTKKKRARRRRVNGTGSDDEESEEEVPASDSETDSEEPPMPVLYSSDDEDVIVETPEEKEVPVKETKDLQSPDEILKKATFINSNDLLDIISDEDYLPCIKILSDWLTSDPEVLRSCGKTTRSLFVQISNLLNLLNIALGKIKCLDSTLVEPLALITDVDKMPLPEDFILKNLEILKESQKDLDWGYFGNNFILPEKDSVALRISKLIAFGRFVELLPETGVVFDMKHKLFSVIMVEANMMKMPIINDSEGLSNGEGNGQDTKKGQLMKNMGQLWLAAEVKDLETRVKGKMSLSPYLVVDVDSLIKYMFIVKSLIYSRKFIVLVPSAVLSALDDLKKEKPEAREAIRWLEAQFNRGNRFFRAQRAQERLPLPFIKYPKKKDKESFIYVQIIECCHYLAEQQKRTTNIVTLLMGDPNALLSTENREISYVGLAQSAGVNLELITEFYAKWKKPKAGKGKR